MSSSSRSSVVVNAASRTLRRPQISVSRTPEASEGVEGVVGGVGGAQVGLGQQQHPRHVQGDVAGADHHRPLGVEPRVEGGVVGVAVVPTDEVDRGDAAGQVLAGDAEPALGLRAHRVDDRVVALQELVAGDHPAALPARAELLVVSQVHVPEEPELLAAGGLVVLRAHRLDLRMVRGDPQPHQAPRGGQPVEHVHPDVELRVEQRGRGVEPRRPGTDDGDVVGSRRVILHRSIVAHPDLPRTRLPERSEPGVRRHAAAGHADGRVIPSRGVAATVLGRGITPWDHRARECRATRANVPRDDQRRGRGPARCPR